MIEKKVIKKRHLSGKVVSTKMDKTAVVSVDRVKKHSKYHKVYTVSTKYKAHDEKNICNVGDKVVIEACRPYSKDKRWRVIKQA